MKLNMIMLILFLHRYEVLLVLNGINFLGVSKK